jgi:hypothetical protein
LVSQYGRRHTTIETDKQTEESIEFWKKILTVINAERQEQQQAQDE